MSDLHQGPDDRPPNDGTGPIGVLIGIGLLCFVLCSGICGHFGGTRVEGATVDNCDKHPSDPACKNGGPYP